jgi:predicted CoA-substrate-specific enzyme activase
MQSYTLLIMNGTDPDRSIYGGIDVGSSATKVALLDAKRKILAHAAHRSGVDFAGVARRCFEEAIHSAGVHPSGIARIIATGIGRHNVEFAHSVRTEISCQEKAGSHFFPGPITIIDIGCQDNKIIRLNERGERIQFRMNRKCAAGTGAFLEEIANKMDIPLSGLDGLAHKAKGEVSLGSYCTVFTQTEILAKIRTGAGIEDIVKGVFRSVLKRIFEMDRLEGEIVATGGVVAHNPIVVEMLEEQLGRAVKVPPLAQITCAIGAALIALQEQSSADPAPGMTQNRPGSPAT